jgi:hypothetical protein
MNSVPFIFLIKHTAVFTLGTIIISTFLGMKSQPWSLKEPHCKIMYIKLLLFAM